MVNTFSGYKYSARLIRAKDGDTLVVSLDLGMGIYKTETIRLRKVDTHELRDRKNKHLAEQAKTFVEKTLTGKDFMVETFKTSTGTDKRTFGRYLADVYVEHDNALINLSELLIEEGFNK